MPPRVNAGQPREGGFEGHRRHRCRPVGCRQLRGRGPGHRLADWRRSARARRQRADWHRRLPSTARTDTVCPVAATVPMRSAGDGQLVAGGEKQTVQQGPGPGQGARREEVRRQPSKRTRTTTRIADHGHRQRQAARRERHGRTGGGHEGGETQGTHQAVAAHAHHGVAPTESGSNQPAQPPQVSAHVPRCEEAQQFGLGVRAQMPAAGRASAAVSARQRSGTEEVLADHPRQQPGHDRPQRDVRQPGKSDGRNQQARRPRR